MESNIMPLLGPLRRISQAVNDLVAVCEDLIAAETPPAPDKAHKDDERPIAPRIPIDRARAILDSATAVGLVNEDRSFEPVFQAVLAQHGVEKIGALNVDQAEAVEAFLAEEAQA